MSRPSGKTGVLFIAVGLIVIIITLIQHTKLDGDLPPTVSECNDKPTARIGSIPMYKNKDIMIGLQLTRNMGHTKFTASTIRNFHRIDDKDIFIFTRHGYGYSERWLYEWYGKNVDIKVLKSTTSIVKSMLQTFLDSQYKILFIIDSNIVFLPSWRDFLTQHMINGNASFVSLYHSAMMHNSTSDCQKYVGNLCEGMLPPTPGVAISHKQAKSILSIVDLFYEYNWNGILKRAKIPGLYPKKSLLMHIDQKNRDKDFCGETDVPYEFQLCDLPCWVTNGIEFFYDRCTNPQELYSSDFSNRYADLEGRMWTKPVISFSLYGGSTRYTDGAIANAEKIFSTYPGWKIWFYIDNTVPEKILRQLCSKNVRFINLSGSKIKNLMSWRFLVAVEPVKMFAIRDLDSIINTREKEAVDEWIKSKRKFHVMRDHPNHAKFPMSGGMWGGVGKAIPDISELILKYRGKNGYMVDMYFLSDTVWPIVSRSVWTHDSHSLHKFGEDHPFPSERKHGEFVGETVFN